ncbi:aspartic peptidase domain-containing protein [Mycena crocata]|nr:aspartic peptidase domain-containing protein [Mycena crocata]
MFLFSFSPLSLFLSFLAISVDARIAKRAVSPPQTLVIPVRLDENQVYSVKVNMSTDPAPQSFSFALTTSNGITTVAGAGCDSCGGVPSYNPSASSSVQQLSQPQSVSNLNGAANGTLMRENCGLLQSNGSAWNYPNQTVTVATQATSFFTPGVSGMIDSPAAGWLSRNPTQPNFSFGMALNPNPPGNASADGDGGVVHWLQPDQSFYEGDVAWKKMISANASSASNMSTWFVEMDAWSVTGGTGPFNISQSGTQLLTFLDPFYGSIVFPQSAARAIYADIPGASKHSTSPFAHVWKLPCDSKFRLTVTFGTFSTSLDQTSLVVKQADGVCVGTIQEWIDAQGTEYLLGSPLIAVLYLIFSYSQSGDGSVGVAARAAQSHKLAPGAIAGVVLGSVAVAALLVIAGVLVYAIFKRGKRIPHKRKFSKTDVTPFPSDVSESTASRHSMRNNGFGAQQQYGQPQQYDPYAGLLESTSTPSSPDWRTTLLSVGDTNTFQGGTTLEGNSRSSHALYRTEVNSSSLINLDSPPPYVVPQGAPPVPLVPLRKNRRPS